ncbi:hypothetical protein V2J09_012446 [Rumex salicifolius]
MDLTRMVYVVAILVATAGLAYGASEVIGDDDWWNHQVNTSYHRSLLARHPDPVSEGSNGTRRSLRKKEHGECTAENPIDACWRCREDWADNRKLLAECALGFGRNTTGGKDGEYYLVTDHTDDDVVTPKPGTLRFAVIQPRPLWIIFSRDMNLKLKAELMVTSDKTIDGRGYRIEISHGPGITIQFAHNIIIHNIKIHDIRPGNGGLLRDTSDHIGIRGADDGDGVCMFAATNIWLDHLSIYRCKDGIIDAVKVSTAITISNCHFTQHDDVMLFGASDFTPQDEAMQITVAFNNFGKKLVQRMPRCRYGFFHVVNNDYTYWEMYAIGGTSHPTIISQGNRYTAPNNFQIKQVTQRNNWVGSEYKSWTWRSEGDLMLNGAFFVESGNPYVLQSGTKEYIPAKPGHFVGKLTKYAGHMKCKVGKKC